MGLALDEPKDTDKTFDVDGLNFVMDEREAGDMLRHGALRIDFQRGWYGQSFTVQPTYGQACC